MELQILLMSAWGFFPSIPVSLHIPKMCMMLTLFDNKKKKIEILIQCTKLPQSEWSVDVCVSVPAVEGQPIQGRVLPWALSC